MTSDEFRTLVSERRVAATLVKLRADAELAVRKAHQNRKRIEGAINWADLHPCDVDSLKGPKSADNHRGVEFWCTTCGSSFKLDRSNRHRQAVELQTDHRRLRVNFATTSSSLS